MLRPLARSVRRPRVALLVLVTVAAAALGGAQGGAATGKGEGALSLLEWPAYSDPSVARGFERQTGCRIKRRDVGSSNQMVALMRNGGVGRYDLVSASADIALLLVQDHDVVPIAVSTLPGLKDVLPAFRSPPYNTVKGVHYGLAVQWAPNLLLFDTRRVRPAPSSWKALYSPAYRGKITVPNNPLQIADAALYLRRAQRSLRIVDPYELTTTQFDAAVALLRRQKPLVSSYWNYASDEVSLFRNGTASLGVGWPYQALTLTAAGVSVKAVIPVEGATGFADSWMQAAKAPHPVCAREWLRYVLTPVVQAKLALLLGETPVNPRACPLMNARQAGSCTAYRLDRAAKELPKIRFWKTPLADCGRGGAHACVPYAEWEKAWARLRG